MLNMRFDDELDENTGGLPVIYMSLGVSIFILLVLGIVIASNKSKNSPSAEYKDMLTLTQAAKASSVTTNVEDTANVLTADDLDFWDMYPVTRDDDAIEVDASVTPENEKAPQVTVTPQVDYDDGEHVKVVCRDGSTEWIKINSRIPKNNYDFTSLVNSGGKMKYLSDGKDVSFLGIDVSKYQDDIDFERLKEQDIDFCMIRVGSRGYKTGALSMDDNFETNFTRANEAGMDIGLYFFSQAINEDEAREEANMVINALNMRKITYPIAIDFESVDNDISRIDTLDKNERLLIVQAFINRINEAGYKAMVYGDKEFLLKKIDVSKLVNCNIWLSEEEDIPDYPYMYSMWQYTQEGEVYGINGPVDMNISFIDFTAQ